MPAFPRFFTHRPPGLRSPKAGAAWAVCVALVLSASSALADRSIYVNGSRNTIATENGQGWSTAYLTLEKALTDAASTASAAEPVGIFIATGNYVPQSAGGFQLISHVRLYGGYRVLNGQEVPNDQSPALVTVLSGEAAAGGTAMTGYVTSTQRTPSAKPIPGEAEWTNNTKVLNGSGLTDVGLYFLTIAGGAAYDRTIYLTGGTIPGTIALGEYTDANFDGMFLFSPQGPNNLTSIKKLPLTQTVIPLSPGVAGGGLSFTGAADDKHQPLNNRLFNHLIISHCVFQGNCALAYGGAISLRDARVLIEYTRFVDNYSARDGGAISGLNSIVNIQNTPFEGNSAEGFAGAIGLTSFPDRAEIIGNDDLPDVDHIDAGSPLTDQQKLRNVLGYALTARDVAQKATAVYRSNLSGLSKLGALFPPSTAVTDLEKLADGCDTAFTVLSVGVTVTNVGLQIAEAAGGKIDKNNPNYKRWQAFSEGFANYTTPEGWVSLIVKAMYDGGIFPDYPSESPTRYAAVVAAINQCDGENSLLLGCPFTGNFAAGGGGALKLVHQNIRIEQSVFRENTSLSDGPAIHSSGFMIPTIFNSTFYQNSSAKGDSAITNVNSSFMQIVNCTLYQNSSQNPTGVAFSASSGSYVKASNSIFWGNSNTANPAGGADLYCTTRSLMSKQVADAYDRADFSQKMAMTSTMELNYCDIQSLNSLPAGSPYFFINAAIRHTTSNREINAQIDAFHRMDREGTLDQAGFFNSGEGIRTHLDGNNGGTLATDFHCISADPQFLTPVLASTDPPVTPAPSSPVVDKADGTRIYWKVPHPLLLTDVLANNRRRGAEIDIGAVETQGVTVDGIVTYVKAGATGSGTSWDDPTGDLGRAMNTPQSVVYVAEGTYHPSTTDRTVAYHLAEGTKVYGGFSNGPGATDFASRDPKAHPTIISGEIGTSAVTDNSLHLVTCENLQGGASLDGFIFQGAYSVNETGGATNKGGGAITAFQSTLDISNCVFRNNAAVNGGAIWSSYGGQRRWGPWVVGCQFQSNQATNAGGALFYDSMLQATNNRFFGNTAGRGGAIAIIGANASPSSSNGDYRVEQGLFWNNSATAGPGGAVYAQGGGLYLLGCTLYGNTSTVSSSSAAVGGGAYLAAYPGQPAGLNVTNSILSANTVTNTQGKVGTVEKAQLAVALSESVTIDHSLIDGLDKYRGNDSAGNINADPQFISPGRTLAADFHLKNISPAINGGTSSTWYLDESYDLDGNARKLAGVEDMGVYEYTGTVLGGGGRVGGSVSSTTAVNTGAVVTTYAATLSTGAGAYQWQVNRNDGKGWVTLTGSDIYGGVNTATLTITGAPFSASGYQFRLSYSANGTTFYTSINQLKLGASVVYVDAAAKGAGDGSSWADAYNTLADAFEVVQPGAAVWVKAGTYYPTTPGDPLNSSASLHLVPGASVLGGFVGGETDASQRDPRAHVTTISGDLAAANNLTDTFLSKTLFANQGLGTSLNYGRTTILDGFVLTRAEQFAIDNNNASPTIRNCVFTDNYGPAIRNLSGSSPLILDCEFLNNNSSTGGAALVFNGGSSTVESCLFANNRNGQYGTIYATGGTLLINQCTFHANVAPGIGVSVYLQGANATITNSILWRNIGNDNGTAGSTLAVYSYTPVGLRFTNSCVQGAATGADGLIATDPLFNDPVALDFTPSSFSPVLNRASSTIDLSSSKDVLGRSRKVGAAADLGAFECQSAAESQAVTIGSLPTPDINRKISAATGSVTFTAASANGAAATFKWEYSKDKQNFVPVLTGTLTYNDGHTVTVLPDASTSTMTVANIAPGEVVFARVSVDGTKYTSYISQGKVTPAVRVYVNPAATGANNGTSWADAYTSLETALAKATEVNDLWVASGVYAPTSSPFQVPAGVGVYGGFTGTETDLSQRDLTTRQSILHQPVSASGRILSCDYADSSADDSTTVIDGFVFENAQATDAAVYTGRRSPSFVNCLFRNNPVAVINDRSHPFFDRCEFTANGTALRNLTANVTVSRSNLHDNNSSDGSVIYNGATSHLQLTDCTVSRNYAKYSFIENDESTLSLLRCDVRGNSGGSAGVIYNGYASLVIESCLFVGNQTAGFGGVLNTFNYGRPGVYTLLLKNSTFAGNYAQRGGGALNNDADTAGGTVANCIFWNNTTPAYLSGGNLVSAPLELQQIRDPSRFLSVHHSTVQGLSTITGTGNNAYYPFFADAANGDYHPVENSPTTDAGDKGVLTSSLDLDSQPRVYGSTVDIGPYELRGSYWPLRLLTGPESVQAPMLSSTAFTITQADGANYAIVWQVWNPATSQWEYIANPPQAGSSPLYHIVVNGTTSSLVFDRVSTDLTGLQFRVRIGVQDTLAYTSPVLTVTVLQPQILCVNAAVTRSGDGTSWVNAFKTIQEAVDVTRSGRYTSTEIWVAGGTYTGPIAVSPDVQLYGGFAGGESARDQRNWNTHPTVLTCSYGSILTTQLSRATGNTLLDGFTLTGNNNVEGIHVSYNPAPAFKNCTFENLLRGATIETNATGLSCSACTFRNLSGVGIVTSGSALTLDGCTFTNINATQGAIFAYSGAITITASRFTGISGGPVLHLLSPATATVSRSLFTDNTTGYALLEAVGPQAALALDSTLIARNRVTSGSTVLSDSGALLTVTYCTIVDNQQWDSAVGVSQGASGTVECSLLWGNRSIRPIADQQQQGVIDLPTAQACALSSGDGTTLTVHRSFREGLGEGDNNENRGYNPLFANPGAGDYSLAANSPAIGFGINPFRLPNQPVDLDLAGNPRLYPFPSGYQDLGAYEFQSPASTAVQIYGDYGSKRAVVGTSVAFTFTAKNDPVQWQVDKGDGNGFIPLSNGGNVLIHAGNLESLKLTNLTLDMSGYLYRFVISGAHPYTSPAATLTVVTKPIRYVNATATGTGDGTTWANAYPNLADALEDVSDNNSASFNPEITAEIWVAAGTYDFGESTGTIWRGMEIYGGFAGGETTRDARDSVANVTTVKGQSLLFSYTDKPDSLYGDPVIDGLTLTEADGAIIKHGGNLTIQNCRFAGIAHIGIYNTGTLLVTGSTFSGGSGAYLLTASRYSQYLGELSSVLVQRCRFENGTNAALSHQAGTLTLEDSTFQNNQSTQGSSPCLETSGISSVANITRCQFLGNTAATDSSFALNGGAIGHEGKTMTIRQSLFAGNRGTLAGAIVTSGLLRMYGVTVADNTVSSTDGAGAVYNFSGDSSRVGSGNCIFWGNKAAVVRGTSPLRQVVGGGSPANFTAQENNYVLYGVGYLQDSVDPQFVGGGDYHLRSNSPYINWGSTANPYVLSGETDLAGNSRVTSGKTDYGAYQNGVSINRLSVTGPLTSVTQAIGGNIEFTIGGATANNYVWEYSADGGLTWKSISQLPSYVTSSLLTQFGVNTLTLSGVPLSLSGYQFRVSVDGQSYTSNAVTATVVLPLPIYVDASAAAGGDGQTWATAYQSLDVAINAVTVMRRILYVAEGTYVPSNSFLIGTRMEIYGGYPAGGETVSSPRDPVAHPTILSGSIPNSSSRCGVVLSIHGGSETTGSASPIQADTILDGLTVQDGQKGIDVYFANPTVRNVTVQGNTNGGLSAAYMGGLIEGCRFFGNTAQVGAGASFYKGNTVTVSRSIFQDNVATYRSGGLEIGSNSSGVRLVNVLVSGNTAAQTGGGLTIQNSSPTIESSVIVGNRAGLAGGIDAIYGTGTFQNSIFWGNRADSGTIEGQQLSRPSPGGPMNVLSCAIEGAVSFGANATGADPLFLYGVAASAAPTFDGDYRLRSASPLLNVGADAYATSSLDLVGAPRFYGRIDLGAYEYQGDPDAPLAFTQQPQDLVFSRVNGATNQFHVALAGTTFTYQWESSKGGADFTNVSDARFGGAQTNTLTVLVGDPTLDGTLFRCRVTANSGGTARSQSARLTVYPVRYYVNAQAQDDTGDGFTWGTAMKTLSRALGSLRVDPAAASFEIWVAKGTYVTTTGTDTSATFLLPDKVSLYGGFAGNETALAARDTAANPTVLNGIAGTVAVVTRSTTGSALVDGFAISNGLTGIASDGNPAYTNNATALTVSRCSFTGLQRGIVKSSSDPDNSTAGLTVQVSRFTGLSEAGIVNTNGPLAVSDSVFSGNGRGITHNTGFVQILRSEFRGNGTASANGGGLSLYASRFIGSTSSSVESSLFSGNRASSGGGLYTQAGNFVVRNCTFAGNYAETHGGGCFNAGSGAGGPLDLSNSILWDNASGQDGTSELGQIAIGTGTQAFNNSIQNARLDTGVFRAINGNVSVNPMFVQTVVASPATTTAGDFHLTSLSRLVDAGSNAYLGASTTDLAGAPRTFGPSVDLGAYEFQSPVLKITSQPADATAGLGVPAYFSVTTNANNASYQWQVSSDGGTTFSNLVNSAAEQGVNTATLVVGSLPGYDGRRYRVRVTTPQPGDVTSRAAVYHYYNLLPQSELSLANATLTGVSSAAGFTLPGRTVNAASVTDSSFAVHAMQTGRLSLGAGLTVAGGTVTLQADQPFKAGELIEVTVTSGVQDTYGYHVNPFVYQFHAGSTSRYGIFPRTQTVANVPAGAKAMAVGDLNGDGSIDLVVGGSNGATVLLNNGDLTFTTGQTVSSGAVSKAVLGSFGFPGATSRRLDLVLVKADGVVEIWRNGGDGTFTLAQTLAGVVGTTVAVGDFNADGALDLFVATAGADQVWFNNGAGTFVDGGQRLGTGAGTSVAVGDLSGDGSLDVVVANGAGNLEYWTNNGAGVFTGTTFSSTSSPADRVQLVDIDHNGGLDVLTARAGQPVTCWRFIDGTYGFGPRAINGTNGGSASWTCVGDVDGDGRPDLITASDYDGTAILLRGTSNGSLPFAVQPEQPALSISGEAELADIDGDGRADLVSVSSSGAVQVATYQVVDQTVPENGSVNLQVASFQQIYNNTLTYGTGRTLAAIRIASLPTNGVLKQNGVAVAVGQVIPVGSLALTFVPATNVFGFASFNWQGSVDGANFGAESYHDNSLILHVPQNLAPQPDQFTVQQGGTVTGNVLTNDNNGESLTARILVPPAHGAATMTADGTFTYTHDGSEAPLADQFQYLLTDTSSHDTATVIVSFTIIDRNDPPSAITYSDANIYEQSPVGTVVGVLAATDPDSNPAFNQVSLSLVDGALDNAAFIIDGSNLRTKTILNYADGKTRTIRVRATDGPGLFIERDFTVALKALPVALAQTVTVLQGNDVYVTLAGSCADGRPITSYAIASSPQHGHLNVTGANVFGLPDAGYWGTDSFTYTVSDGTVTSAPATVTINLTHVNHPPIATQQTLTGTENQPLNFTVTATDPDNDPLTFTVVGNDNPALGSVTGTSPNFVFTPSKDRFGTFRLLVRADDGQGGSVSWYLEGTINRVDYLPQAFAQTVNTQENTAVAITLSGYDRNGLSVGLYVLAPPAHGRLSSVGDNLFYTPDLNYYGPDSFPFRAGTTVGYSEPVTVTINVSHVNQSPVAVAQQIATNQRQPVGITLQANDPDNDPLSYAILQSPQHGTLTGSGTDWTYTPTGIYHGADRFEFSVTDGTYTNTAVIDLTVNEVDLKPVADSQAITAHTDVPATFTLTGSDPKGLPLTYHTTSLPAHGTLSGSLPNGVIYTPADNYHGSDTFTFTTNNGVLDSDVATVTIDVQKDALAPQPQDDFVDKAYVGQTLTIDVLANDSDFYGDPLQIVSVTTPTSGTVAIAADGKSLLYTATEATEPGRAVFRYTVSNGSTETATAYVFVKVVNQHLVVTTTEDSGPGTLRDAIATIQNSSCPQSANWNISFSPFVALLGLHLNTSDSNDPQSALVISGNVNIAAGAPSFAKIQVDASNAPLRAFHVLPSGTLRVNGVLLTGGQAPLGGAILNEGTLMVDHATLTANTALNVEGSPGLGGAIYTTGRLNLINATLADNVADTAGGFYQLGNGTGATTVINTATLSGHAASGDFLSTAINGGTASIDATALTTQTPTAPWFDALPATQTIARQFVAKVPVLTDGDAIALTVASSNPDLFNVAWTGRGTTRTLTLGGFTPALGEQTRLTATATNGSVSYVQHTDITVDPASSRPPVALADSAAVLTSGSVLIPVLANDYDPDGGALTLVSVATPDGGGSATIENGQVRFTHNGDINSFYYGFSYVVRNAAGLTSTAAVSIRRVNGYTLPVYYGDDTGAYTLREAINTANQYYAPGGWTIQIDSSFDSYNNGPTLLASSAGDHGVGDSAFLVTGDMTIDGSAVPGFAIQRDANSPPMRLFRVADGGHLTISNAVVDGGSASHGGVVLNEGALILDHTTVKNGTGDVGGGVFNEGILETDTTTLTQNAAGSYGGALYNRDGTATLRRSTLSNNTALDGGGVGLFSDGDRSQVQLFDTVIQNSAPHDLSANVTGSGTTVLTASGATTVAVPGDTWVDPIADRSMNDTAAVPFTFTAPGSAAISAESQNETVVATNGLAFTNLTAAAGTLQVQARSSGYASVAVLASNGPISYGQMFKLTVRNANNLPPVAVDDAVTLYQGTQATVNVLANDYDPEGAPLLLQSVGPASHGTVVMSGSSVIYTHDGSATTADTFTYVVSDGFGGTATGAVHVTLQPTNLSINSTDSGGGAGSLRQALEFAAAHPTTATWKIVFDPSIPANSTIYYGNYGPYYNGYTMFHIAGNVLLDGSQVPGLTIASSGGQFGPPVRFFHVQQGASLELRSLILTKGQVQLDGAPDVGQCGGGGAVLNEGTFVARNVTFLNNRAPGNVGGAIATSGTATVIGCSFIGNTAITGNDLSARQLGTGSGGAIYQLNGTLNVTGSTFTNNAAPDGASIHVAGDVDHAELDLTGCTLGSDAATNSQVTLAASNGGTIMRNSSQNIMPDGETAPWIASTAAPTQINGPIDLAVTLGVPTTDYSVSVSASPGEKLASIQLTGSDANRTLSVAPANGASGSLNLVVTMVNGSMTVNETFPAWIVAPTPSAPTGLAAVAVSDSQIALTWTDNATNEGSYSVERSSNGVDGWTVVTSALPANTTSYVDGGLDATTQQFYRVQCAAGTSASDYSNVANATTAATIGDGIPGSWRYRYFGDGTTIVPGSEANADPDGDGATNLQEYLAGTDPTDSHSTLRLTLTHAGANSVLSFPTVLGRVYRIEATDSLGASAAWSVLADNIAGSGRAVTYTDTAASTQAQRFYRISVHP